jgi:hypothetical protein
MKVDNKKEKKEKGIQQLLKQNLSGDLFNQNKKKNNFR